MRIMFLVAVLVLILVLAVVVPVSAAPVGHTGQPNQSCEEQPTGPAGFNTAGFQHATTVYAGSGASTASNSSHAVSQYDVACFQLSHKR